MAAIMLRAGAWEVGLLPSVGGAVERLTLDGRDILRRAPVGVTDPLATACFPLVPYANRIADGAFRFDGRAFRVPLNFGDHPHSLHGVGWQSAWIAGEVSEIEASLSLDHPGDDRWPWPFRAEQKFVIDPTGLGIALSLRNRADDPMPAGLGLHPYFPRDKNARLTMTTDRMWLCGDTMLPVEAVSADHFAAWNDGARPPDRLIDNSFEGWRGTVEIASAAGSTVVTAAGADVLHLYVPRGEDFLCVEPTTHLPDALNRGFAMDILATGETLALTMRITA